MAPSPDPKQHQASPRKVGRDEPSPGPGRRPTSTPEERIAKLPLVVALVPDPDVWRVSGSGRTLVARRRSNGRIAWASLSFDLKRPGDMVLFGDVETEEGSFEEILDALYQIEDACPLLGGGESLAQRFTHGAIAWARSRDGDLAEPDAELLAVFGRPRGGDPLSAFVSERDGLLTRELLELCRAEAEADLPLGQSLAVRLRVGFHLSRPTAFRRALEEDADFEREAEGSHAWRPQCAHRKRLGFLALEGPLLSCETVSLDLGSRLCARVKKLADGGAELREVAFGSP